MPIINVTGLTDEKKYTLRAIRLLIQKQMTDMLKEFGAADLKYEDTKVTFLHDPTELEDSPAIAQIVSQYMAKLTQKQRDAVCWAVIEALEVAKRPYNEAYPVAVLGMCYRDNETLAK